MKKYSPPSSYTFDKIVVNSSSFKQVANAFSRGFSSGVKQGMRGNTESPVCLTPILIDTRNW